MILENETYDVFGYYPSDLKSGSSKRVLAKCEDCAKVREIFKQKYRPLCNSCAQKGKHLTEEHKAKIRRNHWNNRGINHPMFSNHLTEEHKAKISAAMKGKQNSLGCRHSEEFKAKISVATKGNKNPAFGKDRRGANNPNWRDGSSFEPYCVKFNNAFKEYIRSKFGFKCFLCPTTQAENGRKLSVHHVNYNKQCGCNGDKTCQFVPLCVGCHSKTNGNREYWQKIIMDKLHCLIIGWNI